MIRRLALILGVMLLLVTACQSKSEPGDAQKPDVSGSMNDEVFVDEDESKVTSPQEEVVPPEYLDESKYSGDELEIVKLMNARMRYVYEQDEKGYMSLFAPDSPISGMPNYTFHKITSMDIAITEQKKLYQGFVMLTELKEGVESFSTMVFWKWKADGDAAKWIIADID